MEKKKLKEGVSSFYFVDDSSHRMEIERNGGPVLLCTKGKGPII